MQREYRLRKRKDFGQVYRRGRSQANRQLVLYHQKGRGIRIGISVSKKLGNAVCRNRIKRRLREAIRPRIPSLKPGRYIIVARASANKADFHALDAAFVHIAKRAGCLLEE